MTALAALALAAAVAMAPDALSDLPEAAPRSVLAQIDKEEVKLGEPFTYTIEVRGDPQDRYTLPEGAIQPPFALGDATSEWRVDPDGSVSRLQMVLQVFALEEPVLPAITLIADGPAGKRRLVVPEQKLRVARTVTDPEAKPRDIRPPVPMFVESYAWLWWLGSALGALGLGWALVRWARARSKRPARRGPPPRPPFDVALEALARLEEEDLPRKGRVREHYFRLSEILRAWLGARYGFDALECTAEELLASIEKRAGPELDRETLRAWVLDGEMVKFAKIEPAVAEARAALKTARELVVATRPPPPDPRATPPAPGDARVA